LVCPIKALRIQHGFELKHNREECHQLIEDWAALGGDGGLTEKVMREACGLKPSTGSVGDTKANAIQALAKASSQEPDQPGAEEVDEWTELLGYVCSILLKNNKNGMSAAMFKRMALPGVWSSRSKDETWARLHEQKLLIEEKGEGKTKQVWIPVIRCAHELKDICDLSADIRDSAFPELLDVAKLKGVLTDHPARDLNVHTLLDFLDKTATDFRRVKGKGRGKLDSQHQAELEAVQAAARKIRKAEETATKLLSMLDNASSEGLASASSGDRRPSKTRRLTKKGSGESSLPATPEVVSEHSFSKLMVHYRYPLGAEFRSRRQVEGIGSQACPRRFLMVLASHTIDLDIEKCCFTITLQLLQRLKPKIAVPEDGVELIRQCAEEPQKVFDEYLCINHSDGKNLLMAVLNGAALPERYENNEFLRRLKTVSRYLRWLACSIAPGVYDYVRNDPARCFPMATTFTYIWNACEDYILTAMTDFFNNLYRVQHMSLHFDGVRVKLDTTESVESICSKCSEYVQTRTGFSIKLREKRHAYVVEAVRSSAESVEQMDEVPEVYTRNGNCIPLALYRLHGSSAELDAFLGDDAHQENRRAETRGHRSYAEVARLFKVSLHGSHGPQQWLPGNYLLHSEPSGKPHCNAFQVADDAATVVLFTAKEKITLSTAAFQDALVSAADKILVCTFRVTTAGPVSSETAVLLEGLLAGSADGEIPEDSDDDDHRANQDDEEEDVVRVGDHLLDMMRLEVANTSRRHLAHEDRVRKRCPLCPFRCLSTWAHWDRHLSSYHDAAHQYCCNGTKQLRIVVALFDRDAAGARSGGDYLRRSADILRNTVLPPLACARNDIDRHIRLVFTGDGPVYHNLQTIEADQNLRRVGNRYYTCSFATMIYRELLLYDGKVPAT